MYMRPVWPWSCCSCFVPRPTIYPEVGTWACASCGLSHRSVSDTRPSHLRRHAEGVRSFQESAFHASYQWLARPLQDFVILRRVLRGREDYTRWKVHEISSDAVRRIKEIWSTIHCCDSPFLSRKFSRPALAGGVATPHWDGCGSSSATLPRSVRIPDAAAVWPNTRRNEAHPSR